MDYTEIANQVVELLKPVQDTGPGVTSSAAGIALWDWIKSRVTRPAAVEAIREVEQNTAGDTNWEALKLQIRKALEDDEVFRKELQKILPKKASGTRQKANVSGDGNVVIQGAGKSNINVQR